MKKLMTLLLASVMSLTMLTGCGDDSSNASQSSNNEQSSVQNETVSYSADVQKIIDSGVLNVGVKNDVKNFGFQDALTGVYAGYEIDVATKIADYLGVDIDFTAVTPATRTNLLDSGDIDCVVATFTITDERRESWDFTTPYYIDTVSVLVENSTGISSLADLDGKIIGVSSGSNSARALVSAIVDAGLIPEESFDSATFDAATWTEFVSFNQFSDYPKISTALASGEVSAFCVDKSTLSSYINDNRSFIDESFAPQDYGVATKQNSGFSELCEELITTWLADGSLASLKEVYGLD